MMKKQHAQSTDDVTLSDLLGSSFAIAQHGIDLAVTGLFKRLKEGTKTPTHKKNGPKWVRAAGDFTRGFVGFFAQAGDSYMKTYTNLKKETKE